MSVTRINRKNLDEILNGGVEKSHEVVIKLYDSGCHLCHALKPEFLQISSEYDNVFFYAFNMEDGRGLEKKWGFSGVPSICYVKTGGDKTTVSFMEDPQKPNKDTWFHPGGIRKFIDDNRR
jgi:thiol-disulfide isomerase/thioredoxin